MGSATLFKAVFINPEQVVRFYACSYDDVDRFSTQCTSCDLSCCIIKSTRLTVRLAMANVCLPAHILSGELYDVGALRSSLITTPLIP